MLITGQFTIKINIWDDVIKSLPLMTGGLLVEVIINTGLTVLLCNPGKAYLMIVSPL